MWVRRASLTNRLSARSLVSREVMSNTVRAGLVTGIPSWRVVSRRVSAVVRWTRMLGRRRLDGTVTSYGPVHRLTYCHRLAAEP